MTEHLISVIFYLAKSLFAVIKPLTYNFNKIRLQEFDLENEKYKGGNYEAYKRFLEEKGALSSF